MPSTSAIQRLLDDPSRDLSHLVELDYYDLATESAETVRVSDPRWSGGHGEPGTVLRGLLLDPGTRETEVDADELGGLASLRLNQLAFSNVPPEPGGDGPLDFLRSASLDGRAVRHWIGDPTYPPPGTAWWTHLSHDGVNDYVSVGDFCDVGGGDYFVLFRGRFDSADLGTVSYLVRKQNAAADPGFRINLNGSEELVFNFNDGTNPMNDLRPVVDIRDDREHVVVGVIGRTSGLFKLYVDGVLVDSESLTATASADTADTFYVVGSGSASGFRGDAIEAAVGYWEPTDAEVASWSGRPLNAVADDCVVWAIDDGSGSTVAAQASSSALSSSGAAVLSDLDGAVTGATWGEATEEDWPWAPVGHGLIDGEPEFDLDAGVMKLRRKTAMERLDKEELNVRSYAGEPHAMGLLTSTGVAQASDDAAHHLTEFTVAGRFWHGSVGTAVAYVQRRLAAGTDDNWRVFLNGSGSASPGFIRAAASSGGVAFAATSLISSEAYDDGEVHWFAFGLRDGHAYLMVDGVVVDEDDAPGTPDLPTAGVAMGVNFYDGGGGAVFDQRVLDHYIAPDEARIWMESRATADEQGLVGLWRFNDNAGGTVTDYSATGRNATITGVEDTDYEWVSSDEGPSGFAGNSMAAALGVLANAPADLVDWTRERWRLTDGLSGGIMAAETIRDEGEDLAGSAYAMNAARTVVDLVSEAGEPLTFGAEGSGFAGASHRFAELAGEALVTRGPYESADLDLVRLDSVYTSSMGLWSRRRPLRPLFEELLVSCEGFALATRDGLLRADMLAPPVSPSPRDGSCLEMYSSQDEPASIEWATGAALLSDRDFTLACWVNTARLGPGDFPFGDIPLIHLQGTNDDILFTIDADAGVPRLEVEWQFQGVTRDTVRASIGRILDEPGWWFVAMINDDSGAVSRFYAAPEGESLAQVGADDEVNFDVSYPLGGHPDVEDVRVGEQLSWGAQYFSNFRGSIFEPQMYDDVQTLSALQNRMDGSQNSTNRSFFADLDTLVDDGLTDAESSVVGVVSGLVVERPDLVIDLTRTPRPWSERPLRPAKRIDVRYARNYAPLSHEQLSATAAADQEQRDAMMREGLTEPWVSGNIAVAHRGARDLEVDSLWSTKLGAQALVRQMVRRWSRRQWVAEIGYTPAAPLRRAMLLEPGDEVRVHTHAEPAGLTYRALKVVAELGEADAALRLWRLDD